MLPNPYYTDLERWAAEAALALESKGIVPRLTAPEFWQSWGASLGLLGLTTGKPLPNPYYYPDWQPWANDFMAAIEGSEAGA